MKTYVAKKEDMNARWLLIDAEGKVLGRLASKVARILQGKHKPIYTPNVDTGDHVIVTNAAKVVVTGKKGQKKEYFHHSGYPGGVRIRKFEEVLKEKPELILDLAVKRMLPQNKLGRAMLKKLHIHPGPDHPHQAQKPEVLEI